MTSLLTFPLLALNVFGGAVSAIWLLLKGDWLSVLTGVAIVAVSTSLLSIVLLLSTPLSLAALYALKRGWRPLAWLFSVLDNAYSSLIVASWCWWMLATFTSGVTSDLVIPRLIWSYGIAVAPWVVMTQYDVAAGMSASVITTFFAQLGYISTMIAMMSWSITPGTAAVILGGFMTASLVVNTVIAFKSLSSAD